MSVTSVRLHYIFKLERQEIVDLILKSLKCYNILTLLREGYYDMFKSQNVKNGTVLQEHDCIAAIAMVHAARLIGDCFLFCSLA
jgi:hypothetical protein